MGSKPVPYPIMNLKDCFEIIFVELEKNAFGL